MSTYPFNVHHLRWQSSGPTGHTVAKGIGRVYLDVGDREVPVGHPGYRGPLVLDAFGVWVNEDTEMLTEGAAEWDCTEARMLIPWARIGSIEWGDDHRTTEERDAGQPAH